jgi:RNA polymerase sigma-70 factor (ECF subfamily)
MDAIRISDFDNKQVTEEEIINRVISGEKVLYEILLRRNNQKLYRVIRGYITHDAEIQDLMQNTYLKAYEKLDKFRYESSFSTWLIRIGINEALSRLREKSRVHQLSTESSNFESNSILEIPDSNQHTPESTMIRQEAKHLLERAIDALPPKYRIIYILREIEELSIDEISSSMDITPENVRVRLHRAKSSLKDNLYDQNVTRDLYELVQHVAIELQRL